MFPKSIHFPINWASRMNHFVAALRRVGAQANGFVLQSALAQCADQLTVYSTEKNYLRLTKLQQRIIKLRMLGKIFKEIPKYDIVHWYAGAPIIKINYSLKLLSLWNKAGIVQWQGDDIRDPEHAADTNPYYHLTLGRFSGQQIKKIAERNKKTQEIFYEYGFIPMASPDIIGYVLPKAKHKFISRHSIDTNTIIPAYPNKHVKKIKICHAPSEDIIKGTSYVIKAINNLSKYYEFKFVLLKNMTHEAVIKTMAECDLFIDQLFTGGHGIAALEAMALGKPTICYITPEYESYLPIKCPIINANIDNLEDILASILNAPEQLCQLGKVSREYVEKIHSYEVVGIYLLDIYKKILSER